MNKVIITGRLVDNVQLKKSTSGLDVCSFTLAVNKKMSAEQREKAQKEGGVTADFIDCVAWRSSAEYIGQYGKKGDKWSVVGRIEKRFYTTNNGQRIYLTEVIVEELECMAQVERN